MDFFDSSYYGLTRWLLYLVGAWPYQSAKSKWCRRSFVIACFIIATTLQISAVTVRECDLEFIVESASILITISVGFITYFSALESGKLKVLFQCIKESWDALREEDEVDILRCCAQEGQMYIQRTMLGLFLSSVSCLVCFFFASLIIGELSSQNTTYARRQILAVDYFIASDEHFCLVAFITEVCILTCLVTIWSVSCTFVTIMQHASGMFLVSGYILEHAFDSVKIENDDVQQRDYHQQRLIHGINYHRKAIKFVDHIGEMYGTVTLISLCLTTIGNTLVFYFGLTAKKWYMAVSYIMFGIAQISFTFLLMYPGQKLIHSSSVILDKTCFASWYNVPCKVQKLLVLIMRRSQTPSALLLGKIYTWSLENYVMTMQTSVSYLMLLFSLNG